KGFVFSLGELPTPPKAVIFVNSGALLTTKKATTVPDLQALAAKGTQIFTCGTCANYYNITQNLAVGEIIDMMGITTLLANAAHLITL
ncbi:DsrE family protein, partial [Ruminococcaceae bacterium OttesenSCG-928-A16]|nr:DsrE family protein [Ruminococcaceae bacterium OttesenSCG-928-A16]